MINRVACIAMCMIIALITTNSFAENQNEAIDKETCKESEKSPLTGYMAFVSNYVYRGVSNSNNNPAVQGSLTYTFLSTGIYLNAWGSNVSFTEPRRGRTATVEMDGILGIRNPVGENFTYDVSIEHYNYPRASGANYNELIAILTYYFLVGQIAYSNNAYNSGQPGIYSNLGVSFNLPQKYVYFNNVNLSAGIGHYSLGSKVSPDYNDYNVTIKKDIKNYTLALQWTDTSGGNLGTLGGNHFIGSVTANF